MSETVRTTPNSQVPGFLPATLAAAALVAVQGCGHGSGDELPAAFSTPQDAKPSRILAAGSASASSSAIPAPTVDALMDWAQRVYPDFFPGSARTQFYAPYDYRYYEASGNYIGVSSERVYVLGPVSGGQLLDVGALADFAKLVATDYRAARPDSDEEAARFLHQAQFSARRTDMASVRSLGYAGWLDQQFSAPQGITAWDWLGSRGYAVVDQYGYYGNAYQVFYALWHQLIASPDAARKRMAAALSEFFVVTLVGVNAGWRAWCVCDYWDMLVTGAVGNFRTLLGKVSLHPAIGQKLTIIGSQKADP
jgi:hypothetical protein